MPLYPELKDTAFSNHEKAEVKKQKTKQTKNRVVEWKALVVFKKANL